MIGLMIALYVWRMVSLLCPHVVPVSAFSMFSFWVHFLNVLSAWCLNVKWVSNHTPRIFGLLSSGRGVLFICMFGM